MVARALFRSIPDSFTRAISREAPKQPIDVALARQQHAAYMNAFGSVQKIVVPADEECPDCVFVEDTCVIIADKALITRPGAPSRQRETYAIANAISPYLDLVKMEPPATLDGGDVMYAAHRWYVGRSARTNEAGIEMLARWVGRDRLTVVDLPAGVLHLKCVVTCIEYDTIVLADRTLRHDIFDDCKILRVPVEETYAANLVYFEGAVICPEEYPRTIERLDGAGFDVLVTVPTTEVQKADGSLTCQSLRWGYC